MKAIEIRNSKFQYRNTKQILISNIQKYKLKFWALVFILVLALGVGNFAPCYAADNHETSAYQRANVYYEQANYDEAIKQYNSILESGLESGNLYYNLGNCYFKKGELGKAILNYEKARRLIPLDKDLESNYEYATSQIKAQTILSKKSLPLRVLNNVSEKFTIDSLTVLLSVFFILILISILINLFFRPFKRNALLLAALTGLFLIIGFTALRGKIALLNKEAIITAAQADAKFEPMDKATTYFTLYEGMKVEIISSQDTWHKVKRPDDKTGWIPTTAAAIF